jgi:diacylglycerol kinase
MKKVYRKHSHNFLTSFSFALNGILITFFLERNFRFHLFVTIVVVVISFLLKLSSVEWLFVLMAIFSVLITEMVNTAIEKLADIVGKNYSRKIELVKDISAGFVLLASIFAFLVGMIIFIPHLIEIMKSILPRLQI